MTVPPGGDCDHVRTPRDVGADKKVLALLFERSDDIALAALYVSHLRDRVDVIAPIPAFRRQVARALEPIAFKRDLPAVLAAQAVDESG